MRNSLDEIVFGMKVYSTEGRKEEREKGKKEREKERERERERGREREGERKRESDVRTGSVDEYSSPPGGVSNAACGPLPWSTDSTHDFNCSSRLEAMVRVSPHCNLQRSPHCYPTVARSCQRPPHFLHKGHIKRTGPKRRGGPSGHLHPLHSKPTERTPTTPTPLL